MARYFLLLSYLGSQYHGWQRQPNGITVQETIELAIRKLRSPHEGIHGCGRTDAGVHASQFYAHVDLSPLEDPKHFMFKLNSVLPDDIAIHKIIPVADDKHARFGAVERGYTYYIHHHKDPRKHSRSLHCLQQLDIETMNEAATALIGRQEFTSFARTKAAQKHDFCDVRTAYWTETENELRFNITADRFLRNMIRAIVGTMLDIGKGKIPAAAMTEIIAQKDRSAAGASAAAHGLWLSKVEYPFISTHGS